MPCQSVTVQDVPDESSLEVRNLSISSPGPREIRGSYDVVNVVDSGEGVSLSGTVEVELDGIVAYTESVTISAGESTNYSIEMNDVNAGGRNVCVRMQ